MNRDEQPSLRGESRLQNAERSAILPGLSASHNSPYWQARTQHSALSTQHSIEIHIEELLLDGFALSDRYHISDAVERELVRLFTEQGVPPPLMNGGEVTRLDAGAFAMTPGFRAEATGTQIAQVVYRGLTQ
jgi:hypothetical protein